MANHTWRLAPPNPAKATPVALDSVQAEAVAWASGPALVLGGPGTGKTQAIIESALAKIADGVPGGSVLVLAHGRDAAATMREAFALRVRGAETPRVTTFHSLALDIVMRGASDDAQLRLLSGAEQERAVREVLDGTLEDPLLRDTWPDSLREAVATRGFAREVRGAFAAARALGLSGDEIARFGKRAGDLAWASVGPVLDSYLETQDQQFALDYAELMFRAVVHLRGDGVVESVGIRHIIVDEYHDTDRMQVALLQELSRAAQSIVVMADPDQGIYGFRGGVVENVRDFTEDFQAYAAACGLLRPRILCLQQSYRLGKALRDYGRAIFGGAIPAGLDPDTMLAHRMPTPAQHSTHVSVKCFDDLASESAHIAAEIRSIVQRDGVAWSDIAVIARSTVALASIERALQRAGVPCRSDVRDMSLIEQPAVRALVRALEVVASPVLSIEPAYAHELLLSPMCGLDPTDLRVLGRALREHPQHPSDQALADALNATVPPLALEASIPGAPALEGMRDLLHRVHSKVRSGATPHEALWLLWSGTPWSRLLQKQALSGSELAHRDLDAVCELFDIADRAVQRRHGHAGVLSFVYELTAQEVPSETLAARGYRGPAVSLLTAHRAKGKSWPRVFVAGVTEGVWPNLRRRGALLDTDRLSADGLGLARSRNALFEEERRLFYVACTRASIDLHVSGVAGEGGEEGQPSRFLDNPELPMESVPGRPHVSSSIAELVAELRRIATDPVSDPQDRELATQRLAYMAQEVDEHGVPVFPEAQPSRWWGVSELTENEIPVDPADEPLYVRGSSLDALSKCSLQWFLQQRVHADVQRSTSLVFGSAIHALADGVAKREIAADIEVLTARLREVWNDAGYESQWQSQRDFDEAILAIGRFLNWHATRPSRGVLSEVGFSQTVDVMTPSGRVERLAMRGTIDRIEISDDGGIAVFDYKTGRVKPTNNDVLENGQLRYYQFAIQNGLLNDQVREQGLAGSGVPRGAHLIQLRHAAGAAAPDFPAVQDQHTLDSALDPWVTEVLGAGLEVVRTETFQATSGGQCQFCQMVSVCPVQPQGRVELS